MDKPKQAKSWVKNPDNDTLLDSIESAMSNIVEAMDYLRGYEEFEIWFDTLDDMIGEMEPYHEQYEAIANAEYQQELEGLRRDYYRSVL